MEERAEQRRRGEIPNTLLLVQHPPTITLGIRATDDELRRPRVELEAEGFQVVQTNRGGLATLHSPGQVVGYPICQLTSGLRDLPAFLKAVGELIRRVLGDFGVAAEYDEEQIGLWVPKLDAPPAKIASIGFSLHQGVTLHGFAVNVSNDLNLFDSIIPCGKPDAKVTRLSDLIASQTERKNSTGVDISLPIQVAHRLQSQLAPPTWLPTPLSEIQHQWNQLNLEPTLQYLNDEIVYIGAGETITGKEQVTEHFAEFFEQLDYMRLEFHRVIEQAESSGLPTELDFQFWWCRTGSTCIKASRGQLLLAWNEAGQITEWRETFPNQNKIQSVDFSFNSCTPNADHVDQQS
jgi:lipoyl(octanoyl) transferase